MINTTFGWRATAADGADGADGADVAELRATKTAAMSVDNDW